MLISITRATNRLAPGLTLVGLPWILFKDWDDTPAWFVGGFWDTWVDNDGWVQGQWNDGILTMIELTA